MSEFINTIEVLGDEATMDAIIERTITEFRDDMLTSVGAYAFYGCAALETVDLPGITSIAANAMQNCSSLSALILRGSTAVTLANTNALTGSAIASGSGYVYVPAALADSYKSATNWSTYAAQIRAIEDYEIYSITLNTTELKFTTSDSQTLTVTTVPAGRSVTWSSSNTLVASVKNGVVTPCSRGTAIITVTGAFGESVSCIVTVNTDIENSIVLYEVGSINYTDGANSEATSRFRTDSIPYDPSINTFRADAVVNGNTSSKARLLLRPYKADGTFISTTFGNIISPAATNNWALSGTEYTFDPGSDCAYVRAVFADTTDVDVSTLTGIITISGITYDLVKE